MEAFQVLICDRRDLQTVSLCLILELDIPTARSQEIQLVGGDDLVDFSWHIDLLVVEGHVLFLVFIAGLILKLSHRDGPLLDSLGDDAFE